MFRKTKRLFKFTPYTRSLPNLSKSESPVTNLSKSESLATIFEEIDSRQLENTFQMTSNQELQTPSGSNINQDIFHSLRIPDAVKDLPHFDGNPRMLYEFLNNVEEILLYVRGADRTPYGQIILRAIRNKITGQANEVLNMFGTALNWDVIKNNLILHYSDKRTETSLVRDLHNLRQYNKTVERFYSEIIEIQSSLCNNILIHEKDQNVISAKKELYAEMCLNAFLTGLREPLGSSIRAMRPESIATALSFCIKEQNIFYMRAEPFKPNYRFNSYKPYTSQQPNRFYNRTFQNQQKPYNTNPTAPFHNRVYQNHQKPYVANTFTHNQPFNRGIQQNQNTFRTNFGNNSNQFNANRPNQPPPEPMDTSSGSSHINNSQRFFKTSPSMRTNSNRIRNFKNEEINFINKSNNFKNPIQNNMYQQEIDQYQEDAVEDLNNIEDSPNFRLHASNNQQVI